MSDEPVVLVNGKLLTVGEAMTLRVALTAFVGQTARDGLGNDDLGLDIAEGYVRCGERVLKLMRGGE